VTDHDLFDALDLPLEAQPLQDAYLEAKREWESLAASYHATLLDLLERLESNGPGRITVVGSAAGDSQETV
jgi:hypothetical protein